VPFVLEYQSLIYPWQMICTAFKSSEVPAQPPQRVSNACVFMKPVCSDTCGKVREFAAAYV
jgi:hypothetical protein